MKSVFLRGTFFLSISTVIFVASGYAINLVLGRVLGPKDYGIYGVVIALWSAVNLILTTGLPQAVSQNIAGNQSKSEEILKSSLIIQTFSVIFISVIYFFSAGSISYLLHDMSLIPFIQLSALIIPFNSTYSLYLGYFNGLHNFKRQSIIDSVYAITKFISIVTLVYFFHIYGALIGFVFAACMASIVGFHYPKKSKEIFPYKKLIVFSFPLIGFTAFSTLHQSIDLLLVKSLLHIQVSPGYYTADQNIAKIPFFILGALSGAIFPTISHSVSQNLEEKTQKLIHQAIKLVLIIVTPTVLLISATSSHLLSLLYSARYAPAASSLTILSIGMGFFTIFILLSNIISGAGRPKVSLIISMIGFVVTTILCILFIPRFGLNGAALGTTIGSFIVMSVASIFVYKTFKTFINPQSIVRILGSSIIVFLLAKYISIPDIFLPVMYICMFVIYISLLFLLHEISVKEILFIRPFLPRRIINKIKL